MKNKKGTWGRIVMFIVAIALVLVALAYAWPFMKIFFGFEGSCGDVYYVVDDIHHVFESLKNGEKDFGVLVMDIKPKCALVSFDESQEYTDRPPECYQKSCLCVCYVGNGGIDSNDCLMQAYCMVYDGVKGFWGDEEAFNHSLFIDSSREYNVPHFVVFDKDNQILYVSVVDQRNVFGAGGGGSIGGGAGGGGIGGGAG